MVKRWLLGGLLFAGGVGLLSLATRRPKLTAESRVLLIGDSLAAGLHPYMRVLAREAAIADYDGLGIVGSRIDQWAKSPDLERLLDEHAPTLVLVSLGTNDEATSPGAVARVTPALHALIQRVHDAGAELVWILPPRLPFESQGVAELIRSAVPYHFESEELDIPRAPDELHPTTAGYAGWAGAIWRWIT